MEQLSRHIISQRSISDSHGIPDPALLSLPEKVLQFGTGVLLRALPDFFIDLANRQGTFNGRIVVVRSTSGSNADFVAQDNFYTVCVRGVENGALVVKNHIITAISRVLSANTEWEQVLALAREESLQLVLSNTTEVGIRYEPEIIGSFAPSSYPAKLLAVLKTRYDHFNGGHQAGLVIIPTELISDNAVKLKQILLELAQHNGFDATFMQWITESNQFCNSLVDRIVPGKPDNMESEQLWKELGYKDALLTKAEPFSLWAIEGDASVAAKLSFAAVHPGLVIREDIQDYKELKLRFLNGAHSICCGLACLAGMKYTREFLTDEQGKTFLHRLMLEEILPSMSLSLPEQQMRDYALSVMDRFANPFIDHQWMSISFQYTSKLHLRVVPLLQQYVARQQSIPPCISFGFACYILFIRPVQCSEGSYWGGAGEAIYEIKDDMAKELYQIFQENTLEKAILQVLARSSFWGSDLTSIEGFQSSVLNYVQQIELNGVRATLSTLLNDQ